MTFHKKLFISLIVLLGQKIGVSSSHEQLFQSEKYSSPGGYCVVSESLPTPCEAKKIVDFEKMIIKILVTVDGLTKLVNDGSNCYCQLTQLSKELCTCCIGSNPIPLSNIMEFVRSMISTWSATSNNTLKKAFSNNQIETKGLSSSGILRGFFDEGIQTCTWYPEPSNCTEIFPHNGNTRVYQRIDFCKILTKISNTILKVQEALIQVPENDCACKKGPAKNTFCKVCVVKGPGESVVTKLVGELMALWAD